MKKIKIRYIIKKKQSIITFSGEGHTMGNFIRSIIRNIGSVEFSGYNVPHPSENTMNLSIISKTPVNHLNLLILAVKISGELSVLVNNLFLLTAETYFRFAY